MESLKLIRPLVNQDDVEAFDCGKPSLNHWLVRNARRNQETGTSRTYVLPENRNQIKGYMTLSTSEIIRSHLPKSQQRNQPDPLPAILLGQLAVDVKFQGQGLSKLLLAAAFSCSLEASRIIGCFALLTHPLDEPIRNFYQRWGFYELPGDPRRTLAIRIKDIHESLPK